MSKKKNTIKELIFDSRNFNKGTEQGDFLLTKSIQEFGFREAATIDKNGVLIGGNKRTLKAGELGFEDVEIIKADAKKVYALQYDDIDITTERGRKLALALNATAKANIVFDAELIEAEVGEAVAEEWGVINYAKGTDNNNLDESGLDIEEFFDPVGTSKGMQRVVFIFDGVNEAESYLKAKNITYKKRHHAWQVNMSSRFIS